MRAFMRSFFADRAFPDDFPVTPRNRHDNKAMRNPGLNAAAGLVSSITGHAHRHSRHQIHAIAPDDRRGVTAPRDLDLPADVFGLAPLERRIGRPGDARGIGPAPLPPIALGG